jgi:hypothetical protein
MHVSICIGQNHAVNKPQISSVIEEAWKTAIVNALSSLAEAVSAASIIFALRMGSAWPAIYRAGQLQPPHHGHKFVCSVNRL